MFEPARLAMRPEGLLQRLSLRRQVETECQVVTYPGFRLLGTEVLDLCCEGMLLRSDVEVELHTPVILSLRIPRGLSWIDAEAEVVRLIACRREGDVGRCLGLRFHAMERSSRALLSASLEGLPPPYPRRPHVLWAPADRLGQSRPELASLDAERSPLPVVRPTTFH